MPQPTPARSRSSRRRLAPLALLVLHAWPVGAADDIRQQNTQVILEPCHLEGLREEARCGRLEVARDPERPDAGALTVTFAVVSALATHVEPDPLFVFPGGPGQAASGYGVLVTTAFREVRETRDLVLIDPRGTTGDAALRCEIDDMLVKPAAEGARALAECAHALGVEPRDYSSRRVASDAESLRAALGYEQVNLWGGSYGTRFALEYSATYPQRTRAVVLDGALGPGVSILVSAARHAERSFALLAEECARDAGCAAAFPDPTADRDAWIGGDARITATVPDPSTGEKTRLELDRDGRIALVRGALYSPRHAALLPLALRRGVLGEPGPLLALGAATASWSVDTMAVGATLAVLCADEAPRIERELAAAQTSGTFVGDSYARFWLDACDQLPHANASGPVLASDAAAASPLSMPALVLSGDRDPVTPPAAGEEAVRAFHRAAHAVVPGAGHNVSHLGCVPQLMREFLDTADPSQLDTSCITPSAPTPFALDSTGFTP